jgi:hypothetical protein
MQKPVEYTAGAQRAVHTLPETSWSGGQNALAAETKQSVRINATAPDALTANSNSNQRSVSVILLTRISSAAAGGSELCSGVWRRSHQKARRRNGPVVGWSAWLDAEIPFSFLNGLHQLFF